MTGFLTLVEVDELLELLEKPVPEERWHGILKEIQQRLKWYHRITSNDHLPSNKLCVILLWRHSDHSF